MFNLHRARCQAGAVLVAAIVTLSGCATSGVDPARQAPKANESAVAITITGNTAQVSAMDMLMVERAPLADGSPGGRFTLHQLAPGLARDTALFVGVLPAGDYSFTRLDNFQTRRFLLISERMNERLGRFRIIAGEATDLGRLIVTPVNTNVVLGRSARVTDNKALMARFVPEELPFFQGRVNGGWIAPRGATDHAEEYALERPVGADGVLELSDGRIVAGSRLGTVLVRERNARWHVLGSEVLESILSVVPSNRDDARLFAVGEFDTILRLRAWDTRMDVVDPGNLPPGNLFFIDGNDRDGWYVGLQHANEVQLLRSTRLEHGDWHGLASDSVGKDFINGGNSAWLWRVPGGLGYAVSAGRIRHLDYASGRWSETKAANNNRLTSISPNPDGSLGILTSPGGGFGGIFASLYLSSDFGATWSEVKSDFSVSVSPPRRTSRGTLLVPGGVFGKQELHASTDGGKTWQARGDYPLGRRLETMPTQGLVGVDAGGFGIFGIWHSDDEGATWKEEYSNFDRAVYEQSHEKK